MKRAGGGGLGMLATRAGGGGLERLATRAGAGGLEVLVMREGEGRKVLKNLRLISSISQVR